MSAWATEQNVTCVVCPDCAFTFDACHTDEPDGGYSCPLCAEAQVVALREALREILDAYTGIRKRARALLLESRQAEEEGT